MHPVVENVTQRIIERSRQTRQDYLSRMQTARHQGPLRQTLSCGNLAHGFAACGESDKAALRGAEVPNIAIVSSYNDMLSAHQPLQRFPALIKEAAHQVGAVAQFAGGVPAMCDGVTQGQPGMELSLFSRDVIAMATAVSLSHNMFDAGLCLGVCDKIVPGLLIGALSFGHLPFIFVPGGPMPTGLSNAEKSRVRQLYAEGKASRAELLEAEAESYHAPGTCTFYGTANSNQMLMEMMGIHLPGAAFVHPDTPLRDELTREAARRVAQMTALGQEYTPLGELVSEASVVNAMVGLLATGGSTNHTMHLVAMARNAGVIINWDDFSELSACVPLLARIYPNGQADVNQFQAAGGMALLIRELLAAGLVHEDVPTVAGRGLSRYTQEPFLVDGRLQWRDGARQSHDATVIRSALQPFSPNGGLKLLQGNLGRGVIKVSAVKPEHQVVEAPARVLHDQDELHTLFERGELDRDCVLVVRFQGPRANGMPELHKLTPYLGVLQDRGFKVALVTDGRMSGASGKVPAAIHVYPEAALGGPLAKVRDGDLIRLDATKGTLQVLVDDAEWEARAAVVADYAPHQFGMGRELFVAMRHAAGHPEEGASCFWPARSEGLHLG